MANDSLLQRRRSPTVLCATALLACSTLAACGGDGNAGSSGTAVAPTAPSTTPTPTPTPPQNTATPVPFNLTQSRTLDVLGWDSWPSAPTPSAIQIRWNAAIDKYELLVPGYADWSRLEALENRFGGPPHQYDVFGSDGTKRSFSVLLLAPPHRPPADGYVGDARIWESSSARAYFAFGIATEPGDVPVSGTMTCSFGEDEIGGGGLTFDTAAGTLAGWAEPFWGAGVRYELVQTSFASGATTFAATFGTNGVLEGRFFGPGAVNVAVRAKGGGQGFSALTGIMTGVCHR
jgi:hypothetical protein